MDQIRRSARALTTAVMTSVQSIAFDTVSIVPSINIAWTTLPTTTTTERAVWSRRHVRGFSFNRLRFAPET